MDIKTIKLDISKELFTIVKAKQGDTKSRFLLFNLYDNSIPFSLVNRTVRAYARKPDGQDVFNDLEIINSASGSCELELTNQLLAVPGRVNIELMIIEGEKKLTSIPFELEVIGSINSENAVISTNEFSSLVNALNKAEEYNQELKDASEGLETKYTERLNTLGSHLEDKASKTEVNNSLLLKADKTSIDNIESQINSLANGSPKGTFATLSALQSDTNANTTDGKKQIYLVTTDGGWYYWNGSVWTKGGTYQSTGIADNSVTKEKLSSKISLYPTPYVDTVIQNPNHYETNLPPVFNGNAVRVIPSEFPNTNYSIKYTPTNLASNYVWVADLKASIWDNLSLIEKNNTENKITVSFIYTYLGSANLNLRGRVYYEDGTTVARNWGAIVPPASNKVFTFEIIEDRPITRGYVYIDMPQVEFNFTNAMAHYGSPIKDVSYKIKVNESIAKLSDDIKKQEGISKTILTYKNWCTYTDGVNNGEISEIDQTNIVDWNSLGNIELSDMTNSANTKRWVGFSKLTANTTPYLLIKANDNMKLKLDELQKSGSYNNDAWIDIDIVIDYPNPVNLTIRPTGRILEPSSWIYFRNIPINHLGGKVKYTRKLYIENSYLSGKNFSDFYFIGTYIVFDNAFTGGNIYFSNITNYCDLSISNKLILVGEKQIEDGSIKEEHLNPFLKSALSSDTKNSSLKPTKVAFVGDSVTWGDGGLNDGYVGVIDSAIRRTYGSFIDINSLTTYGNNVIINSPKFFEGKALMLREIDSYIEFKMKSDRLTICRAFNRNNKGASICEMFIDGVLYDTFSNYNDNPYGNSSMTFIADGVSRKFQLGKAFTYNHVVTLDGVTLKGKLNTSGYGATFPEGDDYMIMRAIDNGEVKHTLFFKTAPVSGTIQISFDYGESVTYAKTTIGEVGVDLNSGTESYYGDGNVAFDPSNAASLSSGLDFRYVNPKSLLTYNFAEEKTRTIKIKIKSLDQRVNSTLDAPSFVFNFATNCDYKYMNAGIGGYKYSLFNNTNNSTTCYKKFMEYEPDIITLMLGTNDDWDRSTYPIYQERTVGASWLEENSLNWCSGIPVKIGENYTVKDRWVDIKAFDKYSITLADSVVASTISKSDILLINKWSHDERYTQTRLIYSYDSVTKKVTFTTPININNISLDTKVYIKSLSPLGNEIDTMINNIKSYDYLTPDIYISCMGVPNMNHRQLLGYREYLKYVANKHKVKFIDLFTPTSEYQAKVKNSEIMQITSTGASEYVLAINGNNIDPILRNVEVFVDGINIFDGVNVTLCGGYGIYHNSDLTNGYKVTQTKLKFKTPIVAGKTITVRGTTARYSSDYTHMNNDIGKYIYGTTILKNII